MLSRGLVELIEGGSLPAGRALGLGCGTSDNAIYDNAVYLADHGWRVIVVESSGPPLETAREETAGKAVTFVEADAAQPSTAGVGSGFQLIVDSGCLQGMKVEDRDGYVREVSDLAAPGARLLIMASGVPPAEVERRFGTHWTPLATGDEPRCHLFERTRGVQPPGPPARDQLEALRNDFGALRGLGFIVRALETTKNVSEPWRRILWGQRPH